MTRLLSRRSALVAMVAVAAFAGGTRSVSAQGTGPSMVILVRHGEKAPQPANDPPLSAEGQARAKALLDALAHSPPNAIFVTPTKRTAETAGAVAAKFGITPTAIPLTGGVATHVNAVAEAVKKASGVVLVVGHSNTIPAIIKALGGAALPDICDETYSGFFILRPAQGNESLSLIRSTYGAVDNATATCGAMTPLK